MKTKYISIVIICLNISLLLTTGCNSEQSIQKDYEQLIKSTKDDILPVVSDKVTDEEIKYDERLLNDESVFEKTLWNTDIKEPSGVLCREADVLIVDKANDEIVVLDYNGAVLKKAGETGNAPLEFINPTGLAEYNDFIYIIDSGNSRVQILDKDLNYVDSIDLTNENGDETTYENIAVESEKVIYLCGESLMDRVITKCNDGQLSEIGSNFYGCLFGIDGRIYAVNRGNIYVNPKEMEMGAAPGDNYLFEVKDDQWKVICELPDGLAANAFMIVQDSIICNASRLSKLFSFNMNGEYQETLGDFRELKGMGLRDYLSYHEDHGYVLTDPDAGAVFYMERK